MAAPRKPRRATPRTATARARRPARPVIMPRARSYADIALEPPTFLWPGRIQLKTVNIVVGHEKVGKGFWGADLAGRISRGDEMPDGTRPELDGPRTVMMITPEDGPAEAYRLHAADANLANVVDFTTGFRVNDEGIDALWAEIAEIRDDPDRPDVGLLWIDPVSAVARITQPNYVVRTEILAPLEQIAREFNLAVVALVHDTKGSRTAAGSKAITEAARVVLTIDRTLLDSGMDLRRVRLTAANNVPDTLAAVGYTIVSTEVAGVDVGKVVYVDIPDEAIAFTRGPVPAKDKILTVLRVSGHAVHYRAIWETLRDGRPTIWHLDGSLAIPGFAPDPDVTEGTVRTALSRLKADPESGVVGRGHGMWDLVNREPLHFTVLPLPVPPPPAPGPVAGIPATPGGPTEDNIRWADPFADFCRACIEGDEHGNCGPTPAGVECSCRLGACAAKADRSPVEDLLDEINRELGD